VREWKRNRKHGEKEKKKKGSRGGVAGVGCWAHVGLLRGSIQGEQELAWALRPTRRERS
jgi:hypothetical protein